MAKNPTIPSWDPSQELLQDQGVGGTFEQAKRWAEQYARAHPEWKGNSVWKAENGRISPRASWLDRNGWIFPAAVGGALLAAPALGALSGGGSTTAATAAGGAGTTTGVGAGVAGSSAALPAGVGAASVGATGAGASVASGAGAAGAGAGAAAAAGGGMSPATASLILGGLSAVGGVGKSMSERKAREEQAKLAREELAQERELALKRLALDESEAGIFRDQRNQAATIGRLDMMESGDMGPRYVEPTSAYASYAPSGPRPSFYTPSDEMRAAAAALKRNVMAGNTTPSQAVAGNEGRTGALNLLPILAGRVDASRPEAFATGRARRPSTAPAARGARGVRRRLTQEAF